MPLCSASAHEDLPSTGPALGLAGQRQEEAAIIGKLGKEKLLPRGPSQLQGP